MSRVPAAKRRRLSPPEGDSAVSPPPKKDSTSNFLANASKWNLEQDYEQRPRKLKKQKENGKLPVRTADGWIAPAAETGQEKEEDNSSDSFLGSGDEAEQEEQVEEVVEEKPKISPKQQILEAKEELARIAGLLNEDPEEHIGALKTLAAIAASSNITVRKLALMTQSAIYKDLIPGYRIRPLSEDSMTEKVSKEVRKLRNFEQKLVSGYQAYIESLAKLAKPSGVNNTSEQSSGLASVAITCACNMLLAVPHFNFRGELLQILVGKLSTRHVDKDFALCRKTLEQLFREDEDGNSSLEAVTMLTKMMKAKNYHFDESVLNIFLHLRLLSELSVKASYDSIDKPDEQDYAGKKIKQKREFRTKKLRKQLKENKKIAKEMEEADAAVSHEERDRMQAETLKMVFVAYFRILKARSQRLMGAVLEGLAKYAHLINQNFFGDILEALRDIISTAELWSAAAADEDEDAEDEDDEDEDLPERNLTRESLLCVITAFALLQGQDVAKSASTLRLDLSFFITHLYRTLHAVSLNPNIELSANSLHLPDPHASEEQTPTTNKINVQTTIVLLIRSLSSVLLPPTALRAVPPLRIAAFCKQLMTIALQLPEKSCTAMLGLLNQVTKAHGRKVNALWITEERRGDGVFDALKPEIEGSNPFAGTVWEGELLRKHYSPTIRDAVLGMEKNVLDARLYRYRALKIAPTRNGRSLIQTSPFPNTLGLEREILPENMGVCRVAYYISNALLGSVLFNKTTFAGTTFTTDFNKTKADQHWQFWSVDTEYYMLRTKESGPYGFLATFYSDKEATAGFTRPRMVQANVSDDSIYWKISPWGDGTFFLSNKKNGTAWHLARQASLMAMDSNVQDKPDGQRWNFRTFNESIDNPKFSTIDLSMGKSTATTITSSNPSTSQTDTATSQTSPPSSATTNGLNSGPSSPSSLSTSAKLAIGLSVSLFVVIALVILGLFLWKKRRQSQNRHQIPSIADSKDLDKVYEADHERTVKYEMSSQQEYAELSYNPRPVEMPLNLPPGELPSSPLQSP
ncbi:hypothetical protein DM02DRAFT_632934 [Periconia macrospinosa]|uniref:Nucleolar complex-associated protein 3 n=1 Tax=Periconia macrospinosa TaxID=97972 RepID=A0A2V1DE29_9PLEO|nr:hypothetical protein DM02DRAFT_632934 [Periconia macrospinosa]